MSKEFHIFGAYWQGRRCTFWSLSGALGDLSCLFVNWTQCCTIKGQYTGSFKLKDLPCVPTRSVFGNFIRYCSKCRLDEQSFRIDVLNGLVYIIHFKLFNWFMREERQTHLTFEMFRNVNSLRLAILIWSTVLICVEYYVIIWMILFHKQKYFFPLKNPSKNRDARTTLTELYHICGYMYM